MPFARGIASTGSSVASADSSVVSPWFIVAQMNGEPAAGTATGDQVSGSGLDTFRLSISHSERRGGIQANVTTRWKGRLLTALIVLGVVVAIGLGLWAMQRRLIYFPDDRIPAVEIMGPGWEEVTYSTGDGLTHRGWFRQPKPGEPIIVVFNGNAGNRADRSALGAGLADAGFGVLLTDYRGYGGNPGGPTEVGLAMDARGAVNFVREHAPTSPSIYFGESLGAAVAIEVAVENPPEALVLRSPFTSLADIGRVHYPWLPVGALLKDRFPSIDRIGRVAAPVLVIGGDADSIVPIEQSRAIFDAAAEPKHLVVVTGSDHNDPELTSGAGVVREVAEFVARVLGG